MPIYEYRCSECGEITEMMQKFSDPPATECPQCKGALKKMVSQSSFRLKGSGWYVTDYKKKNSPKASSDTKESPKKKEASSSDSKKPDSPKKPSSGEGSTKSGT